MNKRESCSEISLTQVRRFSRLALLLLVLVCCSINDFVDGLSTLSVIPTASKHYHHSYLQQKRRSSLFALATNAPGETILTTQEAINGASTSNNLNAFSLLASLAVTCILESEKKRNAMSDNGSQTPSSSANWIDDRSAYAIQSALDKLELKVCFLLF